MAKQTRQEILATKRNLDAFATMISGKNPDGTDWTMNVADIGAGGGTTTTANVTSVDASTSSVLLLALNTNAKARKITNDSDKPLRIKFGTAASATSFTVMVGIGGYYEFPNPLYVGIVHGIWESGVVGAARITEEL